MFRHCKGSFESLRNRTSLFDVVENNIKKTTFVSPSGALVFSRSSAGNRAVSAQVFAIA